MFDLVDSSVVGVLFHRFEKDWLVVGMLKNSTNTRYCFAVHAMSKEPAPVMLMKFPAEEEIVRDTKG